MNKKRTGYGKYGYIFALPFTIAFLIFSLYPILYTTIIGFTDLKGLGTTTIHFLKDDPFKNYRTIIKSDTFRTALGNTFKIWVCNFIPQVVLALALTAAFTDRRTKIRGQGLFKVIFYMPNIITAATIAILFNAMFGYPMGPMNDLLATLNKVGFLKPMLHALKLDNVPVYFLQSKSTAQKIVIFIQTWMWYGYTMIILISGVLGISPDIFEAAEVDGANRLQTFFLITLPNIRTILLFTLVTSLIGGLSMFDIPKLFLLGGPDNATLTTSVFIYNQAFSGSYMYNRASAASMIMFTIMVVCSAVMFFLLRDKDEIRLQKEKKAWMKAELARQKREEAVK